MTISAAAEKPIPTLHDVTQRLVWKAMKRTRGDVTKTSRIVGRSPATIYRVLTAMGLSAAYFRR